jgi:hypothetical protein
VLIMVRHSIVFLLQYLDTNRLVDENREMVIQYVEKIVSCLDSSSLVGVTVAVLFNFSHDWGKTLLTDTKPY